MAVATVTFVGTKAVDAESTTGWNGGSLDTDTFVEGSGSVGAKTSNTTNNFYDQSIVGGPYDFSVGGANEGEHIFGWLNGLTPITNAAIVAGENAANDAVGRWDVGPPAGYGGGFRNYVIDPARDFDTIVFAGTPVWTLTGNPAQLTNVDILGGSLTTSTSIMGNFNNCLVDAISVGEGYRVTGGDGADADANFADFITFEQNGSNRFGALRTEGSVLFMLGRLFIGGTGTENTDFTDSGFTVEWLDAPVAATFYELRLDEGTGITNVTLSNGTFRAQDPTQGGLPLMALTGATSVDLDVVNVIGARGIDVDGAVDWLGGTLDQCGQITLAGSPTLSGLTVSNPTDDGALLVTAAGQLTNVSDIAFDGAGVGGTASDAAIEIDITGAGPFSLTFDNITFANQVGSSVDVHILANGNADYTINVTNNGDTPTVTNDGTGTVTIVNARTVRVTALDASDTPIQGARVFLEAAAGGDLPAKETVTMTTSGGVATVSHTAHGMSTGQVVAIRSSNIGGVTGADDLVGLKTITVVDANEYTYATLASNGTPTGTITSSAVILNGLTNASGVVETTSFSFTNSQPVTGIVRKSTSSPTYKDGILSGSIVSAGGFVTNAVLFPDGG